MTTLNRQNLTALQADIQAALADVMKRHAVNIQLKSCSYMKDGSQATIKLEVFGDADTTIATAKAEKRSDDLKRLAGYYPDLDLDRVFSFGSLARLQVTGYNVRARKTPFIATDLDTNKMYRLSEDQLRAVISR